MPFDARAISNRVLDLADGYGCGLSNLALNKIVYFLHAHFLVERSEKLIEQEFEAWKFGPVCSDIYHSFKVFDSGPILNRAKVFDFKRGTSFVASCDLSDAQNSLFLLVSSFYVRVPASKLVDMSHVKGGPWDRAWNHDSLTNPGMVIPDAAISEFFRSPWLNRGGVIGRA